MAIRSRHIRVISGAPLLLALLAPVPGAAQTAPTAPTASTAAPSAPAPRVQATKEPLNVKGGTAATAALPATAATTPLVPPPPPPRLSETDAEKLSQPCKSTAKKLLERRRALKRGKDLELSQAEQYNQDDFKGMHLDCFNAAGASVTSAAAGVGEEILRSIAQVVLDRAQRAAWRLLQEKLVAFAGCDAKAPAAGQPAGAPSRFPATCRTLGSVPITDLISSPAILTNALVSDFLALASPGASRPWLRIPILEDVLREAGPRWGQAGVEGLRSGLAQVVRGRIKEQVAKADCEMASSAVDKAFWVSGMCLIEVQAPASFGTCDADGWASQCTDPVTTTRIMQLLPLASRLFTKEKAPLSDYVELVCASADIGIDELPDLADDKRKEAHDYVAAIKAVFGGLGHQDWIETTSGAVRVLRLVLQSARTCTGKPEDATCEEDQRAEKLFTLLAAVGNYAETFTTGAKDAGGTREKILQDLVDRMVNRSHRDSGWVVSAGGNLGLFGGARTDFATGAQVAFPVQLGLGLGVQSYTSGNYGFHAMATALDLGQYVSFSGSSLDVAPPALESSVTLGLSVGAWLGLRETPYYLGVYGGVSPFVKVQDKPTYQLGLVTGIYVPLLDFN